MAEAEAAPPNKYRAAVEVLQRGHAVLVEALADEILERAEDLIDGGYAFHELVDSQGTRLHFLSILLAQLERLAEEFEESQARTTAPSRARPKASESRGRTQGRSSSRKRRNPPKSTSPEDPTGET